MNRYLDLSIYFVRFFYLVLWPVTLCVACINVDELADSVGQQQTNVLSEFEVNIRLSVDQNLKYIVEEGQALGIEVRDSETGLIAQQTWLDYFVEFPNEINQDLGIVVRGLESINLAKGHYRIKAFFKEDKQNLVEHSDIPISISCSSPKSLRTPLDTVKFDLALGDWEGHVNEEMLVDITIGQQSCGLGQKSTTLSASINIPENLSLQTQQRLMLHFSPIDPNLQYPLTIPLKRFIQVSEVSKRLSFFINEIPSGAYQIIIFIDSDGDALPTPCDPEAGRGGDQWLSTPPLTLEIEAGESHLIAEAFELEQVLECQPLLTTLGGDETSINQNSIYLAQVDLNPELKQAIRLSPSQKLWFSNQKRSISPELYNKGQALFSLQEAIIANGRFSIHLSQEDVSLDQLLAIWVDESEDEAVQPPSLTPCNDTSYLGSDLWWWQGGIEQFARLLALDLLSPPPLEPLGITRRCDAPESLLEIGVDFNFAWPDLSSARPLVLVFEDLLTGEIYESFLQDIEESNLAQDMLLRRRLKPGAYHISAYLDQDLDAEFKPCYESFLGDRFSSSRAQIVSLSLNETKRINLNLIPRDCPFSRSEPNLTIISYLSDVELRTEEIGNWPSDAMLCDQKEILATIKDTHLQGLSLEDSESAPIFSNCLDYSEGGLTLPSLPAGKYEVELCLPIQNNIDVQVSGDTCFKANYWSAQLAFDMTQAPIQPLIVTVTPSCRCGSE